MLKYVYCFLLLVILNSLNSQGTLIPLDKDLSQVKYPFEVKYYEFTSQGQDMKMAYLDVILKGKTSKTILLLHGKNFNAAYWESTVEALTSKGHRVIAPDQIGFGKSTKPENYQYSFHQLATNTKALLDTLDIKKVIVLGHSMGGMLATRFTLMFPGMVEKLILENPIGLEDYKTMTPYQTVDENLNTELKNTPESYMAYQLKNYYDNKWKPEYDLWLNMLAGWTLHTDYPVIARTAALTTDMVITQPVLYEFKNIKCPTLLIIGTRDRTALGKDKAPKDVQPKMGLYNELGKITQNAIPGSKLVELEGVGHLPHIEDFERFIKAVEEFVR